MNRSVGEGFSGRVLGGHAQCTSEAPALFDIADEDGLSFVLVEEAPAEWQDAARRAAAACPTGAITVELS